MLSDSREREWETERRETERVGKPVQGCVIKLVIAVGSALKPAGTLCGAVQDVPWSGPLEGWERGSLSGSVNNLCPSRLTHASKWIYCHGQFMGKSGEI